MPQRSLIVESTTPLRRSSRLLQLNGTGNHTSNNTQVHPISEFSPPSSSLGSRSRYNFRKTRHRGFPENFAKDSNESNLGPRTLEKSGSEKRASRFSNNLEFNVSGSTLSVSRSKGKGDCPSKSSKGLKESTCGSMNTGKSANKSSRKSRLNSKLEGFEELRRSPRFCNKIDSVDFDCTPKNFRSLKQVIRSELETSPITPLGMGEKKSRCMSNLSKNRIVGHSGRAEMGGMSRFNGKENRSGSSGIIVCGLASSSVYLSLCGTPGGQQARQYNLKVNHEKDTRAGYSCELNVRNSGRMITRSVSKYMREPDDSRRQIVEEWSTGNSSRNVARKAASTMTMTEQQQGIGSLKTLIGQPQKRMTSSSAVSSSIRPEEGTPSQRPDRNETEQCQLKQQCSDDHPLRDDPGVAENEKEAVSKGTKLTGNKRKRKQAGLQGTNQGWTKEQEVALQRAYFAAKPSPHFWKKVARLVPGKSAQECFDKVHSDNLTPLSTRPSRAKKWNSPSDLLLSGCNLFKSAGRKSKKMGGTKRKSHIARRTVRHLLQKYCQMNQNNEADLFSVLEPNVNPSVEVLQLTALQSTPEHLLGSPGSSSKGRTGSSSGRKKCLSRFSGTNKSPLTSPPVLKKVKNMALHEKYIDQLHKREAKRKVQRVKVVLRREDGGENPVVPKDVIRAAKDALVSDARDAIKKFQNTQANLMNAFSDSEEEVLNSEDDDDGSVP
ncbi:hypothetical protein Cgig2_024828 [Carnegiea gigantea]|uniref:Myb-like domain-containing protein n=1 Tax=Carnegiea gigantea TaxID=171969 RepID=A0A9Q1QH46_9CARY|nr:hypothetical protein Cgig2_024828 [Carnegiea gigantea]